MLSHHAMCTRRKQNDAERAVRRGSHGIGEGEMNIAVDLMVHTRARTNTAIIR